MSCPLHVGDILRPNFRNFHQNSFGLIVTCLFFVYLLAQSAGFGQSIQVITAGKPFQPGQLTSHVVTTGKNLNMIQGQADNALFAQLINARNAGYTTIPTSNNQTLVIGPLISNTQTGISIPQQQQQGQQAKAAEMQKVAVQQQQSQNQQQAQQQQIFQFVNGMQPKSPVMQGNNNMSKGAGVGSSAGPTMSMSMIPQQQQQQSQIITTQAPSGPMQIGGQMQGGQMIISPLQCSAMGQPFGTLPPGLTWATHGGIPQPTLLAGTNQIFIRGPQPEGMIFQAPPQQAIQTAIPNSQASVQNTAVKPVTGVAGGSTAPLLQPKTTPRPLSTILPSSSSTSSTTPTPIRPASSVSTQTSVGTSTPQTTTTRPTGKARKVGRPSTNQNQIRPLSAPAVQTPLLQPVQQSQQQQQQQQLQQQAQQQMQHQIVTQQFQIPQLNQIQVQQFQQQSQQQQPQQQQQQQVMSMQFQTVQQTLDNMNQHVQIQQNMNDQQQQQQQQQQHFQQKPMPAMSPVSNGATVSTSTGPSTPTQQPQQLMSPVQHQAAMMSPPLNVQSSSVQQVVMQQPTLMLQPTVSMPYATGTTTTTTQSQVQRTGYKPIAPAPPQQPQQQQQQQSQPPAQAPAQQPQGQTLVTMAPQPAQTPAGDRSNENQQILAIPVGSAGLVYPVRPQLNHLGPAVSTGSVMSPGIPFSPTMGLGMASIHGTVINGSVASSNPTVSLAPSGMTTAPLSAMANMTQTVQTTASIPHQQPVTVAVPSQSPHAPQDPEVKKSGKENGPPALIPVSEAEFTRKDTAHTNGVHHEGFSPVLRDRSKDPGPPQAVVRPQILTHVLGDFVIQESSEPFPVGRFHSPTNDTTTQQQGQKTANGTKISEDGEPPKKKLHMEQPSIVTGTPSSAGKATLQPQPGVCEGCGKTLEGSKFRRAKRFCSTACAKRAPATNTQSAANDVPATNGSSPVKTSNEITNGLLGSTPATQTSPAFTISAEKEDSSTLDAELLALAAQQMRSPVPTAPLESSVQQSAKAAEKPNPAKWTVAEVADFVRNLQGCSDYAEDFALQEIDGQALMLLKADHLMTAMNMKLGPALKICAKIDSMRGVQGGNNTADAQNGTTCASSGNS